MPNQKKYRLVVLVKGREDQKLVGPWTTEYDQVKKDLEAVSNAKEGSGALVTLSWMTVRESEIVAAQIEEAWSTVSGGAGSIPSPLDDFTF